MKPNTLVVTTLAGIAYAASSFGRAPEVFTYTNELTSGLAKAQYQVTNDTANLALDAPHITPRPNETSFNWWYFDAVNPANLNETVVVIFYLATNASFPLRYTTTDSVSADVFITYADKSSDQLLINALPKSVAKVTVQGPFVKGDWGSTGLTFAQLERPDGVLEFGINISTSLGLNGTITLQSTALPHLPCTTDTKKVGETLECLPHVGWTNSMPDAKAKVDIYANSRSSNKHLQFSDGVGYHDTKWGDRPFQRSVKDWYWGHARVGKYSLVWLKSSNHEGKTYSNVYVTRDSKEVLVKCENDAKTPLPDSQLLKVDSDNTCTQLRIKNSDNKFFEITVEKTRTTSHYGPFSRWTGKVKADFGGEKAEGTAFFQEFHF